MRIISGIILSCWNYKRILKIFQNQSSLHSRHFKSVKHSHIFTQMFHAVTITVLCLLLLTTIEAPYLHMLSFFSFLRLIRLARWWWKPMGVLTSFEFPCWWIERVFFGAEAAGAICRSWGWLSPASPPGGSSTVHTDPRRILLSSTTRSKASRLCKPKLSPSTSRLPTSGQVFCGFIKRKDISTMSQNERPASKARPYAMKR